MCKLSSTGTHGRREPHGVGCVQQPLEPGGGGMGLQVDSTRPEGHSEHSPRRPAGAPTPGPGAPWTCVPEAQGCSPDV